MRDPSATFLTGSIWSWEPCQNFLSAIEQIICIITGVQATFGTKNCNEENL